MNYYESKDLGRFAEVGKFKPELMQKFFDYYNEARGYRRCINQTRKIINSVGCISF